MKYNDEKVVALRREESKRQLHSLKEGVYIKDEFIKFSMCYLFDNKVELQLPAHFIDMPTKMAVIKYPSENRPKIIKSNLDGTVNFAFSLFQEMIQGKELTSAKEQFKDVVKKIYPSNSFYVEEEFESNGNLISWFDFKGYTIDGASYNVMAITSVFGQMLLMNFTCPYQLRSAWDEPIRWILQTVKEFKMEGK